MQLTQADVRAQAHHTHVGRTSGHPLWQCSEQPIIYSTLISTHVNPHQSSPAQGDCGGSHTASWQDARPCRRRHFWAWSEPAMASGRLPTRAATSSPFPSRPGAQRKRSTGSKLLGCNSWSSPRPRNTPEATCFSVTWKALWRPQAKSGVSRKQASQQRMQGNSDVSLSAIMHNSMNYPARHMPTCNRMQCLLDLESG